MAVPVRFLLLLLDAVLVESCEATEEEARPAEPEMPSQKTQTKPEHNVS